MIDETTPLPLSVRVSATYPASDGSAPGSIDVVWETGAPDSHGIARVIGALADVARDRYATTPGVFRDEDRHNRVELERLLRNLPPPPRTLRTDEEALDDVPKAAPRAEGGPIRSDLVWNAGSDEREHVTFPEAGAGGTLHPYSLVIAHPSAELPVSDFLRQSDPGERLSPKGSPGTDKDEDGGDGTAGVPAAAR